MHTRLLTMGAFKRQCGATGIFVLPVSARIALVATFSLSRDAHAPYSAALTSPTPPASSSSSSSSSTSVRRIEGVSPAPQEFHIGNLLGCWSANQVASVQSSAGQTTVSRANGEIKVWGLSDASLPLVVTATFDSPKTNSVIGTTVPPYHRSAPLTATRASPSSSVVIFRNILKYRCLRSAANPLSPRPEHKSSPTRKRGGEGMLD
jgi:hypothetical protein